MELRNLELAWAGGFFSGEGTIWVTHNKNRYPCLVLGVAQAADREVIDRFRTAVGGIGKIRVEKPRKNSPTKEIYHLQVGGLEPVQAIVAMLWPWLSTVKREQYKRALAKHLAYKPRCQQPSKRWKREAA